MSKNPSVTGLTAEISKEDFDKSVKHFMSCSNVSVWSYKFVGNKHLTTGIGPCHYDMHTVFADKREFKFYGSNMGFPKPVDADKEDACKRYFDFLVSEESPWYKLHNGDIEYIRDDKGRYVAWIMGGKGLAFENRTWLMNFCIATRLPRDHMPYIQNFRDLVDNTSLTKAQAFYLAPTLNKKGDNTWNIGNIWDGGHEPLNDYGYGNESRVDFKRFKSGAYQINKSLILSSSHGWNTDGSRDKVVSPRYALQQQTKTATKFSSVYCLDREAIEKYAKENL